MNLKTKQRVKIIPKLTEQVITMDETDGFFFLEEYIRDKDSLYKDSLYEKDYNGESVRIRFSYDSILRFIQKLDNEIVYEMYKGLFPEDANKEFPEKEKPLYHLSTNKLVLFFSHSKNVKLIMDIKNSLEKTAWIECFVAHEDIKEGKEGWIEELEKYLKCCHCLIAFLSEDFRSSFYCDQELGVAVHRQIPIFPVKLDNTNPYGFIQHIQATTFNRDRDIKMLSSKIESWLLDKEENPNLYQIAKPKFQKAVEILKNNFLSSTNVQMAESIFDQLMGFKTSQIEAHFISEIQENWKKNNKIKEVKDIEKKMEEFFKKYPQQASKNEKTSHQEIPLKSKEELNTEINIRGVLKNKELKESELPF